MKIIIKNLQRRIKLNPAKIKKVASKIIPPKKFNHLRLYIYFIENRLIRRLNEQFFRKNCLTDVISFNLGDNYAEVFIAPEVVKINAKNFDVEFPEELFRCTIHGILHVFGYSDIKQKEKIKMWHRQESILKQIIYEQD